MRWCVLGPVEVATEARRVALGSERQRTIVAILLAANGAVVATPRLIDGLWGEGAPATAHKTLQTHISRLRRELERIEPAASHAVATATDGYRIDTDACDVDATDFERMVARARQLSRSEPDVAADLLDEAQRWWRGTAFGALADHELVRDEARRLEQLREAAAADRIDAKLALGEHREVTGELEALLRSGTLDERTHAQMMLALVRSGHQAEALETYRRLQDRLRDELGIDPSDQLQRLHEQILRQDTGLAVPQRMPSRAAGARSEVPEGNFGPARAIQPGLVGRDEDVAAVASLVTGATVVTLTGTGGVGKTRLAEAVAATIAESFPDGVATGSLAGVRDTASVPVTLIDALEAQHQGGRPAEETLLAALGTRRLLLVLDNCEHLLTAVSQLTEAIVHQCPHVSVLATSREPLRLPGERVWQVAPLPVPRRAAGAEEVAASPAGALFLSRAKAGAATFELTDANAVDVGELCRRLDGIPLAIELAAARVRALNPADLLDRVDQRFGLLTSGPRREHGRHRTLKAVVEWSYDLLDEAEARLFDRLSVFAGSFPLIAAERVCAGEPVGEEAVAGVLAELVDKSMVVVDRKAGRVRYRLLDTLRDYGAKQLAGTGETGHYRRVHARYHVGLVEQLGPRVRGADEQAALAEIDASIDDLRIAHAWLIAGGDVDGSLRLPVAMRDYLGHRQRDEMVAWTERALRLPGARTHPAYPAALATAARGMTRRGDLGRARDYAEEALAVAEPDSVAAIWALHALATTALYEGRLDEAIAAVERVTRLADDVGDHYYRMLAGLLRVLAHLYRGEVETAVRWAIELGDEAERSGNLAMRAWALYGHGEALLDADPPAAAPLLEAAIEAAAAVSSRVPEGAAMVSLASLWGRHGEVDRALALFQSAIDHWRRLGDWTHQLTTLRNLVDLLAREHPHDIAAVLHGAVTDADPPSFGAEAQRLAAAWARLEGHLGAERALRAAERGRHLTHAQTVDTALATLHDLRAT